MSDIEAAAIRVAFERGGEMAGAVELRRLFPGLRIDTFQARLYARSIAGWQQGEPPVTVSATMPSRRRPDV